MYVYGIARGIRRRDINPLIVSSEVPTFCRYIIINRLHCFGYTWFRLGT